MSDEGGADGAVDDCDGIAQDEAGERVLALGEWSRCVASGFGLARLRGPMLLLPGRSQWKRGNGELAGRLQPSARASAEGY